MTNIGQLLGSGSYGAVYKIPDKQSAIKYIKSTSCGLNELGELNNLKRFNHPNIIKCQGFEIDVENKRLGIILPLADGDMLANRSRHYSHDIVIEWFYQLIGAVHFIHKNGFYHCDIKPANILLIDGKAVLADLGLVGKKSIDTKDMCQSYMSPQLLGRRKGPIPENTTNIGIFKLPSTECQNDIWALGHTFYIMIPHMKNHIKQEFGAHDRFISDRAGVLAKSNIPELYFPLLLLLLDPVPTKRDLSLPTLLNLDLFAGKTRLISGNMVDVVNPNPVIFDTQYMKEDFVYILNDLVYAFLYLNIADLEIQACDLLYRTYEVINPTIKTSIDVDNYVDALLLVILKINNKINYIPFNANAKMKLFEIKILECTDGHLSRLLISDFIDAEKYKSFISWLVKNPEKYEQLSIQEIISIIN